MRHWNSEKGTLWSLEPAAGLPPHCSARIEVEFSPLKPDDLPPLAAAMGYSSVDPLRKRLSDNRRCFCLRLSERMGLDPPGTLVAYGWVTRGVEHVGELERNFDLRQDEAYIWDCRTLPAWRGKRLYSALLSHMIYDLHEENIGRIWIGASRENVPSVRGFENAGFKPVLDLAYYRLLRLTFMWLWEDPSAPQPLITDAYRILLTDQEKRLGPLAIGLATNDGMGAR